MFYRVTEPEINVPDPGQTAGGFSVDFLGILNGDDFVEMIASPLRRVTPESAGLDKAF
ncbi:MAG: hypothetical protein WBM09_08550 [Gallionella sp.]